MSIVFLFCYAPSTISKASVGAAITKSHIDFSASSFSDLRRLAIFQKQRNKILV